MATFNRLPTLNERYTRCYSEQTNVRRDQVNVRAEKLPTIKAEALTSGCWLPPRLLANGRTNRPRHAYQLLVGLLQPGYHLHHICPNAWCINPTHLTPVRLTEHHKLHHGAGQRPRRPRTFYVSGGC